MRIGSRPGGATVRRGRVLVGHTPLALELRRGDLPITFHFELARHAPCAVIVDGTTAEVSCALAPRDDQGPP